jgi:hypothetical protein
MRLTGIKSEKSDFVNQPDKHGIIATQCLLSLISFMAQNCQKDLTRLKLKDPNPLTEICTLITTSLSNVPPVS